MTYYELLGKEIELLEHYQNLTDEEKVEYLTIYENNKMHKGKILFSMIVFFSFNIFQKKIIKSTMHYVLSLLSFIFLLSVAFMGVLLLFASLVSSPTMVALIGIPFIILVELMALLKYATIAYAIIKADLVMKQSDLQVKEEVFYQMFGNEDM